MNNLKTLKGSENYQCQVIKLPIIQKIEGLDNLVKVTHQGNDCLIGKDSNPDVLYLFFPSECLLSKIFLKTNNLYRKSELNADTTQKGFFEDNGRVKTLKFKGVISSGFIIPLFSLSNIVQIDKTFNAGDEFNMINGIEICRKYIKQIQNYKSSINNKSKEKEVDSKFSPEHFDTSHLMKNLYKLDLNDYISVTIKLHGTSARYYNTIVNKKLTWKDKIAKQFGIDIVTKKYEYVSASRRSIKSIGFETLPNKQNYYSEDLWSKVGKEYFEGKLNKGEAIYCEIVGKTYDGTDIQKGYSYEFTKPEVFIYRITNINSDGIEIDLTFEQVIQRCEQLGLKTVPLLFFGKLKEFIQKYYGDYILSKFEEEKEQIFTDIFYNYLLEKSSVLDKNVIEEGFCIRKNSYPKPEIFKIKSKKFLLLESGLKDKEVEDIEEQQN